MAAKHLEKVRKQRTKSNKSTKKGNKRQKKTKGTESESDNDSKTLIDHDDISEYDEDSDNDQVDKENVNPKSKKVPISSSHIPPLPLVPIRVTPALSPSQRVTVSKSFNTNSSTSNVEPLRRKRGRPPKKTSTPNSSHKDPPTTSTTPPPPSAPIAIANKPTLPLNVDWGE